MTDNKQKTWIYGLAFAILVQLITIVFWGGKNQQLLNEIEDHQEEMSERLVLLENMNTPTIREHISLIKKNQKEIEELRLFQAATQSNRFTSADALAVWKAIGELSKSTSDISRLSQKVDNIEQKMFDFHTKYKDSSINYGLEYIVPVPAEEFKQIPIEEKTVKIKHKIYLDQDYNFVPTGE
jgi:hypothetical protein